MEVYSGGDEVELLLNGIGLGKSKTKHRKAVFTVPYTHGELTAVSYRNGAELSKDTLRSGGNAVSIRITPDKQTLCADGQALCFAVVELVDENGFPVHFAEAELTASVDGAATLQAFGSACPITEENYTAGSIRSYHGKALAVIRAGIAAGCATLHIHANGFTEANLKILIEQRVNL